MTVFRNREAAAGAIGATRDHRGDFAFERDTLFEHAGFGTHVLERLARFIGIGNAHLAFAVVAETRALENAGEQAGRRLRDIGITFDYGIRCNTQITCAEERFFADAVLRHGDGVAIGTHGAVAGQPAQTVGRHVFKFSGNSDAGISKLLQRFAILVRGFQVHIGDRTRRAQRIGVEHGDAVTHAVCGEREHAAELAAAEHAEHGVGENHGQNLKLINRMGRMNKIKPLHVQFHPAHPVS